MIAAAVMAPGVLLRLLSRKPHPELSPEEAMERERALQQKLEKDQEYLEEIPEYYRNRTRRNTVRVRPGADGGGSSGGQASAPLRDGAGNQDAGAPPAGPAHADAAAA